MLLKQLDDKYEILERIRESSAGAAYVARHRLLGELRVIHVIRPHPRQIGESRDRVLAQAQAAIRLDHPEDRRILDGIVDDDGVAYVVMEHGPGGSEQETAARLADGEEAETVILGPPEAPAGGAPPSGDSRDETTRVHSHPPTSAAPALADAELEDTVILIRRLRDDGRAGEALKTLDRAVRKLGARQELKTLRYELGEALLERDAEEEDTASRMFAAAEAAPVSAKTVAPVPPPEPASEPPPTEQPALFDPTIRSESAILPPAPERPLPPSAQSNRNLVAVGLILAAVFALLVFVLVRRDPDQQAPVETTDVVAADLTPGWVALDAVPWAEIVSLEKPGTQEEPPAPPSRFTPVILRLPPGEYRLTLRYPPTGQVEERAVQVESDERLDQRFTFKEVDGQKYFEDVGW